jgi:hypothetical protein
MFPVNKRFLYQGLSEDCFNHGIWVYDRIFNNPKNIDIAFLGSSQTINGINDKLIEDKLKNKKLHVVNLGYCRLGVNLYYILIKEIVKTKKPRIIVIEIRGEENRYSHPVFPFIADNIDVLTATLLFNRDFFADCYRKIYYKLEIIHEVIFNELKNKEIRKEDFGFASSSDTANIEVLNEAKLTRSKHKKELTSLERNFHMKYSRSYYEKIAEICAENKIKLIFLYVPNYGLQAKKPKEFNTYIKYGPVLIPSLSDFENTNYWFDGSHLNQAGADVFSNWIAEKITEMDGESIETNSHKSK